MLSALISSALGYPAVRLAPQLAHQRRVRPGPLVLGTAPVRLPAPITDRDRTVSRRSEPSSRATLIGEQPNPWDLLQPQDVTSRHRGGTAGSLCPTFVPARLVCLTVKRPCAIALRARLPTALRAPLEASVTLLEATTPVKLPAKHRPPSQGVRSHASKGRYFNSGSPHAGAHGSQPPAYPTQHVHRTYVKL